MKRPAADGPMSLASVVALTLLALVAFAANSVLCRLALGAGSIDAVSFTVIRLVAGALMLLAIVALGRGREASSPSQPKGGAWRPPLLLFVYAICFSLAYISLDTGTGAVILFGTVQLTIILAALATGDRLHSFEWAGIAIAFGGLVYLMWPALSTPTLSGFVLMTLAGVAWGGYTLLGKGSQQPLRDTRDNFCRTWPWILGLLALALGWRWSSWEHWQLTVEGVFWASLSGALASGLGYTLWYMALRGLSATQAAVGQLTVPVIAALGGVVFVGERLGLRLVIALVLILGGIGLVVLGRYYINRRLNRTR